jgi:hypothetical protein
MSSLPTQNGEAQCPEIVANASITASIMHPLLQSYIYTEKRKKHMSFYV